MANRIISTPILVCLFILSSFFASAQTIHAIICGGTNIPDIGSGCEASVGLINDALEVIEGQSDLTLKTYLLTGNKFSKDNILNTINSINPDSDDVVFFYSTSHGFNYNDNISKYTFIMAHPTQPEGYDQLDKYGLSLEKEIFNVLKSKGARLTITLAEACNNILDVPSPDRYKALSPVVKRNIRALFKEYEGEIIACSSKLGQYSYTDSDKGGFFTNMFMEALNDVVTSSEVATWKGLMQLTKEKTKGYAEARNLGQEPIDNIDDTSICYPNPCDKQQAKPKKKKKANAYFKSNITSKNKK